MLICDKIFSMTNKILTRLYYKHDKQIRTEALLKLNFKIFKKMIMKIQNNLNKNITSCQPK